MHTVVIYIWQNFSGLFVMETYLNTELHPPPLSTFLPAKTTHKLPNI